MANGKDTDISIITLNSPIKWQKFNKMLSVGDSIESKIYKSKANGRKTYIPCTINKLSCHYNIG